MAGIDELVNIEIQEKTELSTEVIGYANIDNSENIAAITNFVSEPVDIFSDPQTPQQTLLTGEIKSLLDNYLQATQNLVIEIERDARDIFY